MKTANRLIKEKSPYLLQHAYNPVDWYPWGDEAFAKAKEEDKPVFLSIGYSTCHWCHVMEHESFEDEEAAALINRYFIPVKVDREERPDIDNIYMQICQMVTGSGGWPLTIFITHDKKPFFAGTYYPKDDRFGRMGLMNLLPRVQDIWINKREDIYKTTDELMHALNHGTETDVVELDEHILKKCFNDLSKNYDRQYGGFGSQPKFPSPHNFLFLLRYWKRTNDPDALEIVVNSLLHMRRGGIYDQIGFGFHRYSTDNKWLVPHFEKMLYDQALMAMAYTEAYQALNHMTSLRNGLLNYVSSPEVISSSGLTGNSEPYNSEIFRSTAEEIFTYVLRDMTSPDGAFYSAEDADSEGEEGKFYLWDINEMMSLLGTDAQRALRVFNVTQKGNWEDPVSPGVTYTNILHLKEDQPFNILPEIEETRRKLFEVREKRVHPYKDDKILTDWNGLMISALARAAAAFNDKKYSDAAEKCIAFIFNKLFTGHSLLHRYREGEASINANCSDYAFMIQGLLDTYEATFNLDYLKRALQLNDIMIRDFWDENNKGFYFASADNKDVIARQKDLYDGAIPSGNSVALLNLVRLGKFTGVSKYEVMASELSRAFSNQIAVSPSAYSYTISALDFAFGPSMEIVISEGENKEAVTQFIKAIRETYYPNKVVLFKNNDNDPGEVAMYTNNLLPLNDKTCLYICRDYVCEMPITNPAQINAVMAIIRK